MRPDFLLALLLSATLSPDGRKYLDEAKKRIAAVEAGLAADQADVARAQGAADDLLAAKRFLDKVQKEAPKDADAAKLQGEADSLLQRLKPSLTAAAIDDHLAEADQLLGSIEQELAVPKRDGIANGVLSDHFDDARDLLREVLDIDPANARAVQARDREETLWKRFNAQREAAAPANGGAK